MQPVSESNALLKANLSAALTPAVTLVNASGVAQAVPFATATGFSFELRLALPYEALSNVLQTFLRGKRLSFTQGFLNQHVVLNGCHLYGDLQNQVAAEVPFSGSYSGTFYVVGTPFYNASTRRIELQNVTYDLKTNSLLLKGAKWLFGNLILTEIKKYAAVDLAPFYNTAATRITELLNREWTKGVQATGSVATITITGVAAQEKQLLLQAQCRGHLELTLLEVALKF